MKLGKTRRLRTDHCTRCGKEIDAATAYGNNARPSPGAVSICIGCNHIMVFGDDLRLRDPTPDEAVMIANDPRIMELSYAVGKLIQERKK
jgi:hypothetical protein